MFCISAQEQCKTVLSFSLDHLPFFRFEHLKPYVPSFVNDSTEMVQHVQLTAQCHLVLAVAILWYPLCLFFFISSIPRRQ